MPLPDELAELPDSNTPAHQHAVATKTWVRDKLGELTARLDTTDPAALADQLWVLMEGTYAAAQSREADGPARHVRALVETLLPGR